MPNRASVANTANVEREKRLDSELRAAYPSFAEARESFGKFGATGETYHLVDAIGALDESIRRQPNESVFYYWRGRAYLAAGRPTTAISEFDTAIRINPAFADAYNCRGIAYDRTGNRELAEMDYQRRRDLLAATQD